MHYVPVAPPCHTQFTTHARLLGNGPVILAPGPALPPALPICGMDVALLCGGRQGALGQHTLPQAEEGVAAGHHREPPRVRGRPELALCGGLELAWNPASTDAERAENDPAHQPIDRASRQTNSERDSFAVPSGRLQRWRPRRSKGRSIGEVVTAGGTKFAQR